MNKLKKWVALLLAVVMCLALAACNETPKTDDNTQTDLAYVQDKGTLVVGITEFEPIRRGYGQGFC